LLHIPTGTGVTRQTDEYKTLEEALDAAAKDPAGARIWPLKIAVDGVLVMYKTPIVWGGEDWYFSKPGAVEVSEQWTQAVERFYDERADELERKGLLRLGPVPF